MDINELKIGSKVLIPATVVDLPGIGTGGGNVLVSIPRGFTVHNDQIVLSAKLIEKAE